MEEKGVVRERETEEKGVVRRGRNVGEGSGKKREKWRRRA